VPGIPIVHGRTSVELRSSPIQQDWILEGNPVARNAMLSRSHDGTACTLIWDCTPGKFEWHYNIEETIHILEGSIVLDDGVAPARRLGPGDVVFFPAGAVVRWTVETHVRKLAFFRRQLPKPIGTLLRLSFGFMRRLRGLRNEIATAPVMVVEQAPRFAERRNSIDADSSRQSIG
jgi:hypothetical protein